VSPEKKKKILVLSVDRDDDLGRKAGLKGPIMGRDKVLDAAVKLGLADPTDSDTNVLFRAVKVRDEWESNAKKIEVAAVTGNERVGIKSDVTIGNQLDAVLKKFKADGVILVTDGKEDEFIEPVIMSKTQILSVDRIIVQQSEELETTYFILQEYLHNLMEDRRVSGLVIGMPGLWIMALCLAYYFKRFEILYIIGGFTGFYIFSKGFGIDKILSEELAPGKFSIFTYLASFLLAFVGVSRVWQYAPTTWQEIQMMRIPQLYIYANPWVPLAVVVALAGKTIDAYAHSSDAEESEKTPPVMWYYLRVWGFAISLFFLLYQVSKYAVGDLFRDEFTMTAIVAMFFSLAVWIISYRQESKFQQEIKSAA
jgi:putative membrane protein